MKQICLELRPLRQKYQESLPDYEANKRIYDSQVEMIESTLEAVSNVKFNLIKIHHKLNQVNENFKAKTSLENEITQLDERRKQLDAQIHLSHRHMERAAEEMKLYVSGGLQEKGRSVRERLQHQMVDQEKANLQLREEQRELQANLPRLERQIQHWDRIEKYI